MIDDESGESIELMEEMPLKELGEAYWKERSVIRREDDVDGRASVTKDEERKLRGG